MKNKSLKQLETEDRFYYEELQKEKLKRSIDKNKAEIEKMRNNPMYDPYRPTL